MSTRFSRRQALASLAILSTSVAMGTSAFAETAEQWPSRTVRVMVGFAPGGGNDTVARILAKELQQAFGQNFVVENRGGAGGLLAGDVVAKAPKDGYTLLLGSTGGNTVAPVLAKKVAFDPRKDLEPVTLVAESGNALLVNAKTPFTNVRQVIDAAKKGPGTLYYASSGNGSTLHLAGAMFAQQAGVDIVHVPYKGNGPAIADVMSGQVPIIFSGIPPAISATKTGQTRILAVTTKKRVKNLPDVPTIAEAGLPGYEFTSWYGLFTTGGTDPAIVEKLAREVKKIMARPDVQAEFETQGLDPETSDPKAFKQMIDRELTHWTKNLKAMGVTAD